MTELTIDELKSTITDMTKMMSSQQVTELAENIQSFFDDIGLQKLDQDKQINDIVEILSKTRPSIDREHIAKLILELDSENTVKQAKKKTEAKQKYIHPDNNKETWSGRGPIPPKIWEALLDKERAKKGNEGKTRQELLKPYLIKK